MIALIQRVSRAAVTVDTQTVGGIGRGILALIGVQRGDTTASADRLLERMLTYRIFSDEQGKMNLSLRDIQGELLLVSQFTLAADTQKGTRAGFSTAAAPDEARRLFDYFLDQARAVHGHPRVASGVFGAHMEVSLVNDGPVTFWLQTPPPSVAD
jgi:D-aminoacyl-tRNA deacylase